MNYWDVINSERERRREREEKEREGAEGREKERGIIIQLSVLRRAELTRTEADFLLLTHPSATSPCRKREREKERVGSRLDREGNAHTCTHAQQIAQNYTHTRQHRCLHVALISLLVHMLSLILKIQVWKFGQVDWVANLKMKSSVVKVEKGIVITSCPFQLQLLYLKSKLKFCPDSFPLLKKVLFTYVYLGNQENPSLLKKGAYDASGCNNKT